MSEVTKGFIEAIRKWVDEEKERDPMFAKTVDGKPKKTVEGACNYVLSQAKASKQCGYSDDEVYGMVRHFFDEDDIKDPGDQNVQRIVINEHVELSESEKEEAKAEAVRQYKEELRKAEQMKAEAEAQKEKERKEALRQKREKEMAVQGDLFGGF